MLMGTRKRMSVFTFIVAVTLLGPTLSAVAQPSAFSAQPMVASASQPLAFALGGLGNPHPRDMVQIYPVGGPDSFVSNIPPQGVHIAYTVPRISGWS
jgi:hypothetical protein